MFPVWLYKTPKFFSGYKRKNACSVTAFNSTDIRSVQDNVATTVTAMMVTVCIGTDSLSSVFISPDLSDTNSFHQCCWSIMPVLAVLLQQSVSNIPVSFCYIRLIQPWQPNRLFQSDTVSSEKSVGDNSLIQLWYHTCISQPEGVTGLWCFYVCTQMVSSCTNTTSRENTLVMTDRVIQYKINLV